MAGVKVLRSRDWKSRKSQRIVTWRAGRRSPTTSTSCPCSVDLLALSTQPSPTCAALCPPSLNDSRIPRLEASSMC